MKLTRKKFTVTGKKFTGHLLGSFAVLLLLFSLGVSVAACEELYFVPQESVFSDIGSVESLNLYLDQAPSGLSGYNLTLSISDPSVARITGVEFPSWSSLNNSSSLPAGSVQIKAVDLTEKVNAGASDVFLGKVTVESLASGKANLTVFVNRFDDDSENTISVTILEAKLTVGKTAGNSDNPIVSILPQNLLFLWAHLKSLRSGRINSQEVFQAMTLTSPSITRLLESSRMWNFFLGCHFRKLQYACLLC